MGYLTNISGVSGELIPQIGWRDNTGLTVALTVIFIKIFFMPILFFVIVIISQSFNENTVY